MARAFPLMSVIADFTAGPPNVPGLSSVALNGSKATTPTVVRQVATQRGRQYELNKCQAGTMTLDVVDGSEYLNPVNGASPWNSGSNSLLPYRCAQTGAWWNTATRDTTGNLLNAANFPPGSTSAYDPSFETSGSWVGNLGTAPARALSTAQHFDGAQSLAITYAASTDGAAFGLWTVPGQAYTLSLYVYVPTSHTVTATFMNFPGAIGSTIATATSSTTGAWQRLTMTGVPAGAVSALNLTCSTAYPATVYLDAVQLELGAAASAFTTAGPTWFPVYTGYVERYPQKWDTGGFRGLKSLEAVDALSPLSRAVVNQSYAQTVLADGPNSYIPYNDDGFPQTVLLPKGGQPPIGYTQLGTQSGAVNFGGDTFPDGSKAVTVSQQNADPVTTGDTTMLTYLGTRQGAISMNPQAFTLEMWVKFTAGVIYGGAAAMQVGESTVGEVTGPVKGLMLYTAGGQLDWHLLDPNGGDSGLYATYSAKPYPDGKWHHIVLVMLGGSMMKAVIDGTSNPVHAFGFTASAAILLNNLYIQAQTYYGDPVSQVSVANWATYPATLSDATITAHYQRGTGYLGELPGVRALRLLTKYWSTNVTTDPGKTALSPDFYYDPPATPGQAPQAVSVLSALEDIADTEMGLTWVDAAGKVHFDSRDTRYLNQQSALFVFGENEGAGELPYLNDIEYDYDPTYVYSEADLTCDNTGNTLTSVNATSQTNYGQRILSKTMYAQNEWDVQQAANFYTQRYAKPAGAPGTTVPPRITTLSIDPGSNPKLFAAALSLDIGERVTVKRRTSAGVTITGDYYIEQVNHQIDAQASTWTVHYQLSPVFVPSVWILGDAVKGVLGTTTYPVY